MIFYNLVKIFENLASTNFLGRFYAKFFEELVIREIKEAHICSQDKILQIGCGSVPYTAQILARKSGAKIVAIDNDPDSVKKAREYLKRRHPFLNIKIELGDGMNYPLQDFSVILLSLGVKPTVVIERILKQRRKNTRVIFRRQKGLLGKMYNVQNVWLKDSEKVIKHRGLTFRESILIK